MSMRDEMRQGLSELRLLITDRDGRSELALHTNLAAIVVSVAACVSLAESAEEGVALLRGSPAFVVGALLAAIANSLGRHGQSASHSGSSPRKWVVAVVQFLSLGCLPLGIGVMGAALWCVVR